MCSTWYLLGLSRIIHIAHVVASATTCKDDLVSAGQSLLQTSRQQRTPDLHRIGTAHLHKAGAPLSINAAVAQPSPNLTSKELLCELKRVANMSKVMSIRDDGKRFPVRTYRTCSVVSSSGVLLAHHFGTEIDSAEAVFRFNDAPVQGFEDLVGKKETIRLVNNEIPQRALEEQSVIKAEQVEHIVTFYTTELQINAMHEFVKKFPKTPLYRVENDIPNGLASLLRDLWDNEWFSEGKGSTPTTGLVGMMVVLSLCDHVKAYGMAASSAMSKAEYHYYDVHDAAINHTAGDNSTMSSLISSAWPRFKNYHQSFAAEKDLWRLISMNSTDDGTSDDDVSVIPGFSQIPCEAA